jgi:tRNA(Ile)-lysidine synthase
LRVEVLPLLWARLGQVAHADLLRVARAAAQQRRAWQQALELVPELGVQVESSGWSVARAVLARYDAELAVQLVRAMAERGGVMLGPRSAQRILALAKGTSGRRMQIGQGWFAEAVFDRLVVCRERDRARPANVIASAAEGNASFGEFAVSWRSEPAPSRVTRDGWTTWVEGPGWEVRALAAGDRLRPLGGVGRRPVRRLLMEARVPRGTRAAYPVLVRGQTILWVPGVCRSADELPSPGTQAVRVDVSGTADA